MDTKKVIEKLVKIAIKQQQIINKLAQATPGLPPDSLPTSKVDMGEGGQLRAPAAPTAPQSLRPATPKHMNAKDAVLAKLKQNPAPGAYQINVDPGSKTITIKVRKGTANSAQPKLEAAVQAAKQDMTLSSDWKLLIAEDR